MARPKNEQDKPLTDVELQIMNSLWDLGSGTVHEVSEALNKALNKDYAYTTVSTLLRVLEKKSAVRSEKEGRGHRYFPAVDQKTYQHKATDHLITNVFSGSKSELIKNLLGQGSLSKEELEEVKALLKGADS